VPQDPRDFDKNSKNIMTADSKSKTIFKSKDIGNHEFEVRSKKKMMLLQMLTNNINHGTKILSP
jgi:hypothetical protein